ncbi:pkd domain containing protein [Fusarium oxysporum f. sp. phaseoli]
MFPFTARQVWSCFCATAALAATVEAITSPIVAKGPACVTNNGAVQVTADCVDSTYNTAIIDAEQDFATPVAHRRVSGHFSETNIDFNIYLPKSGWDGRFFQLVYPLQNSTAEDHEIGFGADSGGYTNHVAGGGGYRADAAVAKLSRTIAARYYQSDRKIYGYIYGASGGSMVTVGAVENTFDVWQGAIPIVQAITVSNPNNFCIRAMASLVLESQKEKIRDSVHPGGDGDPFSHLNALGKKVLTEVTELGLALESFEDWEGLAGNRTTFLRTFRVLVPPTIAAFDPTYVNDFWTKDGYLGTEKSDLGDFYRKAAVEFNTAVKSVMIDSAKVPVAFTLAKAPPTLPAYGLQATIKSGDGKSALGQFTIQISKGSQTAEIDPGQNTTVLAMISKGSRIQVDNRAWLAGSAYHRYQVPTQSDLYGYDYLRKADGTAKYPQRNVLIGPTIARAASGGATFTGNITNKVIIMDSLKDFDAFPWHADWYRTEVKEALGDRFGQNFRLYYTANADHYLEPVPQDQLTRIVSYHPAYEQHLRDLSAWVEKGKQPPAETSYSVGHGQVKVPASAAQRKGIQPIVDLTVSGKTQIVTKARQVVSFKAHIEVPPGTGSVTSVEWDFEGTGDFEAAGSFKKGKAVLDVAASRSYQTRGTYFAAVRVTSNRNGDANTAYAQVANLGRVRVVVN